MAIKTLVDYHKPINLKEEASPSVVALADSARGRGEILRKKEVNLYSKDIIIALSIPALMYTYTTIENIITGVNTTNPLVGGMIAGMFFAHKPIEYSLLKKYFSDSGNSLVYNPKFEYVTRTNDSFMDKYFGFYPLKIGENPFLLDYNVAEIMPVVTGNSGYNGHVIDSSVDNIEMFLRIPEGISVKESSKGLGVIMREGKRTFSILAFAPLESIL